MGTQPDEHAAPPGGAVTIKQVAREAGVSIATVSRFLNGTGPVGDETRERLRAVTERLHYVPHGAARSLITRQTHTVGVLLPDLHGEFFSELMRGMDAISRERGFHLLVSGSHGRSGVAPVLRATRGRVDGLVIMSPDIDAATLSRNLQGGFPVLLVNPAVDLDAFDAIEVDNFGGAREMTRHLMSTGRRRIAFVAGPAGNHDAEERRRGYREALGSDWSSDLEFEGDFGEESGHRAALRILAGRERPDAVFAGNDSMAIGLLSGLRDGGLRVPDDIALAGFDDVPIARFVDPPLTTVRVSIADLGARAMVRLLDAVAGRAGDQRYHELIKTTLVVRRSCGSAPAASERGCP